MVDFRQKGDDLASFVRGSYADSIDAQHAAVRITSFRAARQLRRDIVSRFGTSGRVYAAKGFAKAILVRKRAAGWWEVADKATYSKGRSVKVGLAWVFDNSPTISGKKGWTAVPIKGAAPIASSGRRHMWPSEASRQGYELEIAAASGKRYKIIFGRRGPRDAWRAMWLWIPPYRAKKALDLDGIHRKHSAQMDTVWGEELDSRTQKRVRRQT
jgi:hypothetical protein